MRGLPHLKPDVRAKAERLLELCREAGLPVRITETFRTKEEQDTLYSCGRTAPGRIVTRAQYPYSPHCWGVAFDFCRDVKGREYDDGDGFFEKVGELGKSIGLFWGGDFKTFKDRPHFEDPAYMQGCSARMLIERWGSPEGFKAFWGVDTTPDAGETVGTGETGTEVAHG